MKSAYIIHGWAGDPSEGWLPWLKNELIKEGFNVVVPQLPSPMQPRIHEWIPAMHEIVGVPDENSFFIGHSLGCQAIARFIESASPKNKIGGVVFVAGFFKSLTDFGLEGDLELKASLKETDNHWLSTSIDFDNIERKINSSVAIFSDNDPFVPLNNIDDFRDKFKSKIILLEGLGHISGQNGVFRLPEVLQSVLSF